VLSDRSILLSRSLSHCVSQENHLMYHIISTLCIEENNTSFHLHLRENNTPNSWASSPHTGAHSVPSPSQRGTTPISWAHLTHGLPHPTQGHTTFILRLREEQHTHLMGTPNSWALSQADSLSLCLGGCLAQL
jgi:hypothetical protein